jgi:hypothetical protein
MRKMILPAVLFCTLAMPALADNYPVTGVWGQSTSSAKGAIDCSGKRVVSFSGNQRTDSNGAVPAYRNKTVTQIGSSYRVVDQFSNGQVNAGSTSYTLRQIDADHIELQMQQGGTLKLQRCE